MAAYLSIVPSCRSKWPQDRRNYSYWVTGFGLGVRESKLLNRFREYADIIYGNVVEKLRHGEQKRTVDKAKDLIFRSVAGSNCGDSDGRGRGALFAFSALCV